MDPHNLTMAFTVWAAVVALMGGAMVIEMRGLRNEVSAMRKALNDHIVDTTERLTALEAFNKLQHGYEPAQFRNNRRRGDER